MGKNVALGWDSIWDQFYGWEGTGTMVTKWCKIYTPIFFLLIFLLRFAPFFIWRWTHFSPGAEVEDNFFST